MKIISHKIIEKTRIIDCSLEIIWKKWTTHEGLLSFLGIDNKVDLRIGGAYEIYFLKDKPYGEKGGEGNKIISYVPKEMLSFTWSAPPQYPEVRNHKHKAWIVVNLNLIDSFKTKVCIKHLGWLNEENWHIAFNYFDRIWENVLDRLQASCIKENVKLISINK